MTRLSMLAQTEDMRLSRAAVAGALVLIEGGIALSAVLLHYGFTAEYGDITDTALEGLKSSAVGGLALVLVGVPGLAAAVMSTKPWMRLTAIAIPAVMVVGMLGVTPVALRHKLETHYDPIPRCVTGEDMGPGPGRRAERHSQQAFDSIEHVGHFGGGGQSGVGGCDRSFLLTEDVDVLAHYRRALAKAGWRLVEDDSRHLRAELHGMAFEVITCDGGGVVWAGRKEEPGLAGGRASCGQER